MKWCITVLGWVVLAAFFAAIVMYSMVFGGVADIVDGVIGGGLEQVAQGLSKLLVAIASTVMAMLTGLGLFSWVTGQPLCRKRRVPLDTK